MQLMKQYLYPRSDPERYNYGDLKFIYYMRLEYL